jgi:hypothetical protein
MKFIITEEDKNHIRNLYDLISEGSIEDYLVPSQTVGTETFIDYLKKSGIDGVITFKKNCLSQPNCFFGKKEIKKLTPLINDKWDALADKCWECYGKSVTNNVRISETMTKKIEELKPYCQKFEQNEEGGECNYRFSEDSRIYLSLNKDVNGVISPFLHGILSASFINDTKNQVTVSKLKNYGKVNSAGNITINKTVTNLDDIIDAIKNYKTA